MRFQITVGICGGFNLYFVMHVATKDVLRRVKSSRNGIFHVKTRLVSKMNFKIEFPRFSNFLSLTAGSPRVERAVNNDNGPVKWPLTSLRSKMGSVQVDMGAIEKKIS